MKRMIALLVLLLAAKASGQPSVYKMVEEDPKAVTNIKNIGNTDHISVRAAGVPAYKIVRTIADTMGYEVIWRDMPKEPLSVTIVNEKDTTVLSMVLNEIGYRYEKKDEDRTLIVYRQDQLWEQPPNSESRHSVAQRPAYTTRDEPDFWLRPTPEGLTQQEQSEWYRLRRMRPDYDPCDYGDYGCDYGGYGSLQITRTGLYSPRYYGSGGQFTELLGRRIQGAATHGYLKLYTMSDVDFSKHLVVLRLDNEGKWRVVGAGGKGFRNFHDPLELPIGRQRLRFELRRNGLTRYYEEDFEIESKFDRDHPLQYPISDELMNSFAKTEAIIRK
ncbi:MAG: hypothetical protein KW802_00580 [Candidatus Doudnabacteria bacterium]|nr:hypothetical protein [Candidatus Doudnabacteria bacterium]